MFAVYLVLGALSGAMSGLLGIGGGIIVVPGLAAIFSYASMPQDYIMHMAIGTSLAAMIMTTSSALRAHHLRGAVRWDIFWQLLPGLTGGAVVGAVIAHYLPSEHLRIFFSLFLFFVAYRLLFAKYDGQERQFPSRLFMGVISSLIGMLASILGAGGGSMLVPFMMHYRVSLLQATGTSVACGVGLGIVATLSFMIAGSFAEIKHLPWSTGYIYWPAFLGVAVTSVLFAPMGARLAHTLPRDLLRRIFAIFLFILACDMLFFSRW